MKNMQQWLDEYAQSHQNPANKLIHFVCVPLIYFSVLGLIWDIPFPWLHYRLFGYQLNWAIVATALVFTYYAMLSPVITIGMMLLSTACLFLLRFMDYKLSHLIPVWTICIIIFVFAWIGQFYGHRLEGKKPSFFKDVQFLLIGPAWIMSYIFTRIGIKY